MKYAHILSYIAGTVWAIDRAKLDELLAVIAYRSAGHMFTQTEIAARIGSGPGSGSPRAQGGIAVIPIRGVIAHRMGSMDDTSGGTSTERIGAMIEAVAADEAIGTIVYDVDSPGGTVTGVQELADQMFALRGQKKQIAHVNGMAASAAYWLASQADEIVSMPSGLSGSIGVFTVLQDVTAALEKEGIKIDVVKAGKFKAEGNPYEPMSEEGRAFIQGQVDEAYGQFVKAVARGRGVAVGDVRGGYGEGRALTAKDAKAAGLIDSVGTFDDTIGRLAGRSRSGLRAEVTPDQMIAAAEADMRRRMERF